jgi:hypothetical protein
MVDLADPASILVALVIFIFMFVISKLQHLLASSSVFWPHPLDKPPYS